MAGFWEGGSFCLREFPANPGRGSVKNVDWSQTMGKVQMRFVLKGPLEDVEQKDIAVEMSSWELKVSIAGRPDLTELLSPLRGDFHDDVRRAQSWWVLEEDKGKRVIVLEFVKKSHRAWSTLWKAGMNPHRKQHFGWGPASKAPIKKAEEMLVQLKGGRPLEKECPDRFICSREHICLDMEDGQDAAGIILRIRLLKDTVDKIVERVPLSELFGVDITEKHLKVFIRGDERSPILMGELGGKCIPDRTTWEITKAPEPEEAGKPPRPGAALTQCLEVKIVKKADSRGKWESIIIQNSTMIQREAAPPIQELERRALRAPSPDRSAWTPAQHAAEQKEKGDNAFKKKEWKDAAVYYTRALEHTPDDEKLYSNRSAAWNRQKKNDKALTDARKAISLKPDWPKAYFREGVALRGLNRWEEAIDSFSEGRFREARNPEWEKEIERTEQERAGFETHRRELLKEKREMDQTTELNEATTLAEEQAMITVADAALKAGKSKEEAGKLAAQGMEMAKKQVHEAHKSKFKAAVVEDDKEITEPPPYRIVQEDGSLHGKGFAHTERGQYFMGMTRMHSDGEVPNMPWVEILHPKKLRWSQTACRLKIKVHLPESVRSAAELIVRVERKRIFIGTEGDADAIVEGDLERNVEPDGENFSWWMIPEERPPMLEMTLDKDQSEIYGTLSYGTLLWPRLFNDDRPIGEGLFECDLTDLPEHLLKAHRQEQARSNARSLDERTRRKVLTEEEVFEETGRNWNEEFRKHNMDCSVETNEDKLPRHLR